MMRRRREMIALAAGLLALAGCATVQTESEYARVGDFARQRIGAELSWERTAEEAESNRAAVADLLGDGLTRPEAVQIALLNNSRLQAAFEELGVAKADLVQAGFFTNPRLDGLVRFPTQGGGTNVEAEGFVNLADLWQIPVRKRLAATRMEASILRLTDEILDTTAEAKRAHDEAVALAAARDETARLLEAFRGFRDEVARRRDYGYASDFDVAFAEAAASSQEAALARVEGELRLARSRLSRILGLSPEQAGYAMAGALPEEVVEVPGTEALVSHALARRPDVQLAQLEIVISQRALKLERARVFTHVEAGASFEREPEGGEGGTLVGPALGLQLPLFDQNQAQIAKATYRLRQARKLSQSLEARVRQEVAAAAERLSVARRDALLLRREVLPAYGSAMDYAEKYAASMQLNMLFVLEAQKEMSASRRELIEALLEARAAEVDLERALGGAIPSP